MAKRYARINWQNSPSVATPLSAENLNKMDKGIKDCDDAIGDLALLTTNNKTDLVSAINEQNNNLTVQSVDLSSILSPASNFAILYAWAVKYGKMVQLSLIIQNTVAFANETPICTYLPVGYRPPRPLRFPCMLHTNPIGNYVWGYSGLGYAAIGTDGAVYIRDYSNSNCTYAIVHVTYIAS